jgi:hypothetical protein
MLNKCQEMNRMVSASAVLVILMLTISMLPHAAAVGDPSKVPLKYKIPQTAAPTIQNWAAETDTAVQGSAGAYATPLPNRNWAGLNFQDDRNVFGGYFVPPDTQGDVGPTVYVQIVNMVYAVYDKSTGSLIDGPRDIGSLWSPNDICSYAESGDPIVLYDHLADRWVIAQMALPGAVYPWPSYECIAVSKTGDPTGGASAFYTYTFLFSNTKMNDYQKIAIWPDGIYQTANQFCDPITEPLCTANGWGGQGVAVYDKAAMYAGGPANSQYFDLYTVNPNLGGMLPASLDGAAPPYGAPALYAEFDSNRTGFPGVHQLDIWQFHVDWTNAVLSTFTPVANVTVASFDADVCHNFLSDTNCIPQPGYVYPHAGLDTLSDRLMFRLQYRNFGSYQTLVTSHTVNANGGIGYSGIRWYELRKAGLGPWAVRQQSTYAIDGSSRWMPSAAMNGHGDIAIGYSISSSTVYPSIRYALHSAAVSPLSTMGSEVQLIGGGGVQAYWYDTPPRGRWGDYSMMSVDPTDDCTFWYTQEYYPQTASGGSPHWYTQIGSFSTCQATVIPEYPLGLALLAIFMVVAYGVIRRKSINPRYLK